MIKEFQHTCIYPNTQARRTRMALARLMAWLPDWFGAWRYHGIGFSADDMTLHVLQRTVRPSRRVNRTAAVLAVPFVLLFGWILA